MPVSFPKVFSAEKKAQKEDDSSVKSYTKPEFADEANDTRTGCNRFV
jgi:hypothetical protein